MQGKSGDVTRVLRDQSYLTWAIWAVLLIMAADALIAGRFSVAFVALATLALSLVPVIYARWAEIHVPSSFMLLVVAFVGGTLFLGEVYDFYERFWWWDIAMHGASALGFGLIGFVLVFMMFQGNRFAAPHGAVAFFGFCFGMAIGVGWEIFEFGMDQLFGLNMQKSGLNDTMGDLIVDFFGAGIGAMAGWAYLRGRHAAGLQRLIGEFIEKNPRLFQHQHQNRPGAQGKDTRQTELERNDAD
ncbi:hypothetical protein RXV86_03990 [Alisedimentitalea sp. MJ-SS2]|uniref:hypothetical protein n=1 Tax=Aliisedimentitalea sp. MJ-SS2 TaxID=3049795 RepID=UPI00290A047A|nr:hypothetical protein [Alisedimentitalea sp. MJ-SS2]MDU8926539.1 hypothetical protein [Alisedimentitalea sp. MJ-SS2]